jgi:hypothetical protein
MAAEQGVGLMLRHIFLIELVSLPADEHIRRNKTISLNAGN